jgi:glucosamine 6-phosphate synthetase-like amidotransferase/phosphosugar isomerase protein
MTDQTLDSPLLADGSPLDDRQKAVVERVSAKERAGILALPTDDPLDPERRRRVDATRGEMLGQQGAIRATWERNADALPGIAARIAGRRLDRVFLVGAGDSLAVMIAARRTLELMLGVPCEPVQALEFAYYQQHLVTSDSLVVALSSSGETTRTVEALLVAQHAGALTLALTNTPGSTLDVESGDTLLLAATRVGWPTQSSTTALSLLLLLAVEVGRLRGVDGAEALRAELETLPETVETVLEDLDDQVAEIARIEAERTMYLFSASGPTWAAAIIGAAKVKETSPDHAVEIQVEEFHHYNSQKPGEPMFLFAPSGPSVPRGVDTGRDAHRYGGTLYVATTVGETAFDGIADDILRLPVVSEALSPLLYVLPAQLIGYHLGMAKFAVAEREASRG